MCLCVHAFKDKIAGRQMLIYGVKIKTVYLSIIQFSTGLFCPIWCYFFIAEGCNIALFPMYFNTTFTMPQSYKLIRTVCILRLLAYKKNPKKPQNTSFVCAICLEIGSCHPRSLNLATHLQYNTDMAHVSK